MASSWISQVLPPAIIATLYAAAAGGTLLIAGIAAGKPTATRMVLVPPDLAASLGVPHVVLLLLGLAALLPLIAAIALLSATLQNLLALLWPSWIQLGRRRSGSAAHIGQGWSGWRAPFSSIHWGSMWISFLGS